MSKRKKVRYKAGLNKSDAPETDDFICFHGLGKNDSWVNAELTTFGELKVVVIDSWCGEDVAFGPQNTRLLANKLLKWADEMEKT